MSENRNNPDADKPGPQDGTAPDQTATPAAEDAAPTQRLYGQYGTPDVSGSQPFAAPASLPYGQAAAPNQGSEAAQGAGDSSTQDTNGQGEVPSWGQPFGQAAGDPASSESGGQPGYGESGDQPAYGQPAYGQPGYGGQPAFGQSSTPGPYGQQGYPGGSQSGPYGYPGAYQPPAQQPGKTMGIVGLILSCLFFIPFASLVGVILSIVAFVQSRKAKMSNGPALAGIIIGGVVFVLTLVVTILLFVFAVDQVGTLIEICEDRGPGTHFVDGEVYECNPSEFGQSL